MGGHKNPKSAIAALCYPNHRRLGRSVYQKRQQRHFAGESGFLQQTQKLTVYAYVIMTNHLHLILSVDPPYTLSGVLRDFKKYTATKLLEAVKTNPESRREWLLYLFAFFGKKRRSAIRFGSIPMRLLNWQAQILSSKN
ncbi:MAG: transposase [Haliscomenobacter sp.]|nr:transposase [Haliscomenobacter sp.]